MKIPTSTKEKNTNFEKVHIQENVYNAQLIEVKDITDGEYGKRVAFIYKISLDTPVELAFVCYNTSPATKDNKLGQTLVAHGVDINGSEIDTDNLPKKDVRVFVEDYDYQADEDGKKVDKIASTISKVKPLIEIQKVE